MTEQLEIATPEELEDFLKDQPIEWGQVVAMRAALRYLPVVNWAFHTNELPNKQKLNLLNTTARACLMSWFARKYPTYDLRQAPAAFAAANAASAAANAATSFAANASTKAASSTATSAANAASFAANAASTAATASFVATSFAANADATASTWEVISSDATSLLSSTLPTILALSPLWPEGEPRWAADERRAFFALPIDDLDVWQNWYQRISQGKSPFGFGEKADEALSLKIATQDDDFWDRDFGVVNGDIKGWIEEVRREQQGDLPEWDFFISYAHQDKEMAKEIDAVVREQGYSTIAQFKDFPPGSNFVHEMQKGLNDTSRMIALHSPDYEKSDHCQAEWAAAYNEDPGSEKQKLVPFLISPAELNPLARQVVYSSLVGKNKSQRKKAIIEAINYKPPNRSRKKIKQELANVASPDATLNSEEKLDAGPNRKLDNPHVDNELADLPYTQREIVRSILDALSAQAPASLRATLERYSNHLLERGPQPITDLLAKFNDAIMASYEDWGDKGISSLFESYQACHEKFMAHFPLRQVRERLYSETPINEQETYGDNLLGPVEKVQKAIEDMIAENGATDDFEKVTAALEQQAKDLSFIPPQKEGDNPAPLITPKRRFLLSTIGFYERLLAAVAGSAALVATPQGQALIAAVNKAIDALLKLVL